MARRSRSEIPLEIHGGEVGHARKLLTDSLKSVREHQHGEGTARALEGFALLALHEGRAAAALQIAAAADALRQAIGVPLAYFQAWPFEQALDTAREHLGSESSAATWAEGRSLTVDAACNLALGLGSST